MSKGYVYILSNPSMPGLVKIGKTTRDVEARANELYQTGVPTPFAVEWEYEVPDCDTCEALVHRRLSDKRVSGSREFFKLEVEDAITDINAVMVEFFDEMVSNCLGDWTIAQCHEHIDLGLMWEAMNSFDINGFEVLDVLYELTSLDLQPAVKRYIDKREKRRAELRAKGLHVVGGEQ